MERFTIPSAAVRQYIGQNRRKRSDEDNVKTRRRRTDADTRIQDGDVIEIVQFMGGG